MSDEDGGYREYKGRLSNIHRNELYKLLAEGTLVEGPKTHYGFVKLIYAEDHTKEACTMCHQCMGFFGHSSTSRVTL